MKSYLYIAALIALVVLPHEAHANRLFSSGCELGGDSTPAFMTQNLEFDRGGSGIAVTQIVGTPVRSGLSSCRINATSAGWGNVSQQFKATADANPVYARFYLNIGVMPQESADIANWGNGVRSNMINTLALFPDGTLKLIDQDGTTVLATYSSPLSTNTWYRVEMYYDKLTTGSAIVRIDGTQIMNVSSLTGGNVNTFSVDLCTDGSLCGGDFATIATLYFDDIAINDGNGTSQTSWPGPGHIVHLQPNGAGDNSGCTAGSWSSVSEITPDDASSICTLTTDGGGDILDVNMSSSFAAGIPQNDTISLVQVGVREAAASAAAESWQARIKSGSGGTVTTGTLTMHDDTTYRTNGSSTPTRNYTLTSYADPTTGNAWKTIGTNSLDNMQVGITDVDANPDINVSTLWALVEFVEGPKTRATLNGGRIRLNGGRFLLQSR